MKTVKILVWSVYSLAFVVGLWLLIMWIWGGMFGIKGTPKMNINRFYALYERNSESIMDVLVLV